MQIFVNKIEKLTFKQFSYLYEIVSGLFDYICNKALFIYYYYFYHMLILCCRNMHCWDLVHRMYCWIVWLYCVNFIIELIVLAVAIACCHS